MSGRVCGNEGNPRHILHPDGPPNFSKLVQSAVKLSNELIEKDSIFGGVIAGFSIRPDLGDRERYGWRRTLMRSYVDKLGKVLGR